MLYNQLIQTYNEHENYSWDLRVIFHKTKLHLHVTRYTEWNELHDVRSVRDFTSSLKEAIYCGFNVPMALFIWRLINNFNTKFENYSSSVDLLLAALLLLWGLHKKYRFETTFINTLFYRPFVITIQRNNFHMYLNQFCLIFYVKLKYKTCIKKRYYINTIRCVIMCHIVTVYQTSKSCNDMLCAYFLCLL